MNLASPTTTARATIADVVVIGLGAMGSATLHRLALRGVRTVGIDRWRNRRDLLLSVPGIGETLAAMLLAKMPKFGALRRSGRMMAYAGLNPSGYRPGTSIDRPTRIFKAHYAALRSAPYMPALSALRYNPAIAALVIRPRSAGHLNAEQIVVATMYPGLTTRQSRHTNFYPPHFVACRSINPIRSRTPCLSSCLLPVGCSGRVRQMDWINETITKLRELWDEGHSTAEIGRRLGVSKNAVVGKAHRLHLPARPSPIRSASLPGRQAPRPTRRRPKGSRLPTLADITVAPLQREPVRSLPPLQATAPGPRSTSRLTSCCWPLGEPGTQSFRFCDDAALAGKPYCAEHASIAYVKVRERREDAA